MPRPHARRNLRREAVSIVAVGLLVLPSASCGSARQDAQVVSDPTAAERSPVTTDEHENDVATPAAEIDPADLVCYVGPVEKRAEALAHIDRALREHPPADRIVESWLPESLAAETRDAAYSVQVREEDALHRVEIFFTGRSGDELQFGVTSSREIVNAWAAWSEPPPGPSAQPSREARIEEIVRRCASAGGHLGPSAVRSRSSSSR